MQVSVDGENGGKAARAGHRSSLIHPQAQDENGGNPRRSGRRRGMKTCQRTRSPESDEAIVAEVELPATSSVLRVQQNLSRRWAVMAGWLTSLGFAAKRVGRWPRAVENWCCT